jgi:DNA-directed RNA polymerase subunit K/omega
MHDFDKMRDRIGNRFDLILVASERLRELHRERKRKDEQLKTNGANPLEYLSRSRAELDPTKQTFSEIENGQVGREYLARFKHRGMKKSRKYDLD